MAKIEWTEGFLQQLNSYIGNASIEFGKTTALRWAKEIAAFEHRLESFPTSYSTEPLLHDKELLFRGCHVMNRRFKIIYYYDEAKDVAHLVEIWDTKANPKAL